MLSAITEMIRRSGPIPFDAFMEVALYGDGGFYSTGAGAGRGADFITSPEVGPLFGAVVARALDSEWERLGAPDPFVVVEGGAGRGALARAVLDARPACAPALRYVCVERSPVVRARIDDVVPTEPASNIFGAVVGGDPDEGPRLLPGGGPVVAVLDDLPTVRVTGLVLANELLDNLPVRLLERTADGWDEIRVGVDGDGALTEVPLGAPPDLADEASRLAPEAATGARLPLQRAAADWLRRALGLLDRGRVVIVDYADTTPSLAARPWHEWLRTYRSHGRGGHPLDEPGSQDITCEVATDQLARARRPTSTTDQATWLARHGVGELVADARASWHERAHVGDLEAVRARSRVGEGDALSDPTGLGAFRVLEWEVGR